MIIIKVWLLVAVSSGASNYGITTVVGHFPTLAACMFVAKNIPVPERRDTACIQTEIVK